MNISRSFVILLVMCLGLLLLASTGWSQTPVSVKIYCSQVGKGDSVVIGDLPNATNGTDTALGEPSSFPPTTKGFDFRCESNGQAGPLADTLAFDPNPTVGGSYVNYHKLVYDTQRDVFRLGFKPDSSSTMTLSWPTGLASIGAGYWKLKDDGGNTTTFGTIDMTTQTSIVVGTDPVANPADAQGLYHVYIIKSDAMMYHLATANDLYTAVDSKGKGGSVEKAKPYAAEARFTVPVPADSPNGYSSVYLEFGSDVLNWLGISPTPTAPPASGKGNKKFTITFAAPNGTLKPPTVIHVWVETSGGKFSALKKVGFTAVTTNAKYKMKPGVGVTSDVGSDQLLIYKPNWNNVGAEVYAEDNAVLLKVGLTAGLTSSVGLIPPKNVKPVYKYVYMPAWKDVNTTIGTASKGGGDVLSGAAVCLDAFGGKTIVAPIKALAPSKRNPNQLLDELITLKFNMLMSDFGHTGTGLRNAKMYAALSGITGLTSDVSLNQLALIADSVISCKSAYSPLQILTAILHVNATFSNGTFDTTSWSGTKTVVKPYKAVGDQSYIYRTSLAAPAPMTGPNYYSTVEQPVTFKLGQNYPNPFNPTTQIDFSLSKDAFVTLKVYNILGQEVATLFNHEQLNAGDNTVQFNGASLASGVYFYRLVVNDGEFQQIKKMMLLK